jgi:hypothetical protein
MRTVDVVEVGANVGRQRIIAALTALWASVRDFALRIPHSALLLFFGWRFLLFLTVVVASQLGGAPPTDLAQLLSWSVERWDAGWYIAIARDGYSLPATGQANVAFYPLLPLLIRVVAFVVPSWQVAGAIVVNAALLGAVLYLYALVQLDQDQPTALRAVAMLLLFPTAIFLTAIYTESLLLLTMIAAVYHARRGQWWLAGFWGLAAGLTKFIGAAVAVALLWEWGRQVLLEGPRRRHLVGGLAVATPAVGALSFLGYLQWRFGTYDVYFAVQESWYRQSFFQPFFPDGWGFLTAYLRGDGGSVVNYFYPQNGITVPSPNAFMVLDLLFLIVGVVVGFAFLLRLRASYGLLVLAILAIAVYSGSPQSLNRIALILFPLPIAFAIAGRYRPLGFALFALSGLLSLYHTFLFVNAFWAG